MTEFIDRILFELHLYYQRRCNPSKQLGTELRAGQAGNNQCKKFIFHNYIESFYLLNDKTIQ